MDTGNAFDRLLDAHGRDLIYCPEYGFMVWRGTHWAQDDFIFIERLAEKVIRNIFAEVGLEEDKDDRSRIVGFINSSLSRKGITNMCHSAKRKLRIVHLPDFDSKPYLLNVKNGVINLRTGVRRQHARIDFASKLIPINTAILMPPA